MKKYNTHKNYLITSCLSLALTMSSCLPAANAFSWGSSSNLWQTMSDTFTLTGTINSRIQKQIDAFTRNKSSLEAISSNAQPYLYYVYQEVKKRHMPAEIALLPIIESDYYPFSLSSVGAEGMWQMMKPTAKDMGITMNWWFDGRRDTVASTTAALDYLNDLHNHYHDWALTLAAYNVGEGRVDSAIKYNKDHHLPTDYWSLKLPQETLDYVPKFLAVANIVQNPGKYHFKLTNISDSEQYTFLTLHQQINLEELANLEHMDSNELLRLNPGFIHWVTPANMQYTLVVPTNKAQDVVAQLQKFTPDNLWFNYTVNVGDTLASIASNHNLSSDDLKQINALSSNDVHVGQTLQLPVDYSNNATLPAPEQAKSATLPAPKHIEEHQVLANETLDTIAQQFHVATVQIEAWNNLATPTVTPGQELVVSMTHPLSFSTHPCHVSANTKKSTSVKTQTQAPVQSAVVAQQQKSTSATTPKPQAVTVARAGVSAAPISVVASQDQDAATESSVLFKVVALYQATAAAIQQLL